ncbi:MAG: hypothetical protein ACFFD1_13200 [Candidatus Thorarchaeota archaeon]
MVIFALYIVSINGKILVSENFHTENEIPNTVFLGGLINALQGIAKQLNKSDMKSIEMEGLFYHFKSFGIYRVVLVTDSSERPDSVLNRLGLRIMKEFRELIEENQLSEKYVDQFHPIAFEILNNDFVSDESKLINPTKKFGTEEIYDLPHNLKKTALAMVLLKEGTTEEIAMESGINKETTKSNLLLLQKMGFIGTRKKNGEKLYFCSLKN